MSSDVEELSREIIREKACTVLQEDPHSFYNQYDAALLLSVSLSRRDRFESAKLFLQVAAQQSDWGGRAKKYFLEWAGTEGQWDLLSRDVLYMGAALRGIVEAQEKIEHLFNFTTQKFQDGVPAYQRYQIIQGLQIHHQYNDSVQYIEALNVLKNDLTQGSLKDDPRKNKVLDKINREIVLHDETLHHEQSLKQFYFANRNNSRHKKLTDLKEIALGERIVVDYWKGLFKLNIVVSLLLTIPAAIVFPFYAAGAGIKKAATNAEKPPVVPERTAVKQAKIDTSIHAELSNIKDERLEKKRHKISNQYAKFYQQARNVRAAPQEETVVNGETYIRIP